MFGARGMAGWAIGPIKYIRDQSTSRQAGRKG